jgi:caffeoyl-CoA O-methyltransferase
MIPKFLSLTPALYDYIVAHSAPPPDDILHELAAETAALGAVSVMQVAVEQGALLTMLARLMNARTAIEIGTFTGYSAICIARGLAEGGQLLCCDVNPEWTAIAQRYWTRAGLADRITLRLGPAIETLRGLPLAPAVDLAFIDADKTGYGDYYDELLPRLRPNGLLVFDNALWGGSVIDATEESAVALRALADRLHADARVDTVLLGVADGLLLARKR